MLHFAFDMLLLVFPDVHRTVQDLILVLCSIKVLGKACRCDGIRICAACAHIELACALCCCVCGINFHIRHDGQGARIE